MTEGKSLKDQNAWLMKAVIIAYVAALTWVVGGLSLDPSALAASLVPIAVPGTIALGLIAVASLLALGSVPPNWSDRLIHWRWRHPLPGARAFSLIGPECNRVSMDILAKRYCPLPSDAGDQDRRFYAIYLEFEDEIAVLDPHRRYLAARDIGTINAIFIIPLAWLAWLSSGNEALAATYAGLLALAYATCAIAAQNYSVRLVQNVLSLASARSAVLHTPTGTLEQVAR